MNSEVEAADQVYRLVFNGTIYFMKAALEGSIKLAGILMAVSRQENRTRGAVRIARIAQEGKGFCSFVIPAKEFETFKQQAKEYGLLYATMESKEIKDAKKAAREDVAGMMHGKSVEIPEDAMYTIICAGDKASLVNTLLKANKMHGHQVAEVKQVGAEQASQEQASQEQASQEQVGQEQASQEQPDQAQTVAQAEEEIDRYNEELINMFRKDTAPKQENPNQEVAPPKPDVGVPEADPITAVEYGNLYETGSQKSTANTEFEWEEPDIENLETAITMGNEKNVGQERKPIRERLKEIKQEIAKAEQAPAAEQNMSFTSILMKKAQEKNTEFLKQQKEGVQLQ